MKFCTQCGHELGIGRFCTNCGFPVPGASVEPPAQPVEPPDQPPAQPAPPFVMDESNARYPLFADEVPAAHTQLRADESPYLPPQHNVAPADVGWAPTPGHTAPPSPSDQPTVHRTPQHQERRGGIGSGWLIFAAGLLCLLLIGGFAIWLLSGGDDDKKQDVSSEPTGKNSPSDKESPGSDTPPDDPENPTDIARYATAVAPATAPPGQDLSGDPVRFDARNMLDGQPATAWRMKGDGASQVLTFDLEEESVITQVGLINGYAKTDRDPNNGKKINWYMRNRRITQVEWIFDGGEKVQQTLSTNMKVQHIDVDDITTKRVQLRIVSIGAPPEAERDYTVISEVSLVGAPPA